jgi:ubiquinone/menaquinone biosynthesis C-methylase UbiE
MNRGDFTQLARKMRLMHGIDLLKYAWQRLKNGAANRQFRAANPDFALPPDYMLFEAYQLNYQKYIEDGKQTAAWVVNTLSQHKDLKNANFLDWGCGPARVTRHLPDLLGNNAKVFGTDYNHNTIAWCARNIENVTFTKNSLQPPMHYRDGQFDALLGISIFTHLSEEKHWDWINELARVLDTGGVAMLTTHGTAFKAKLTKKENEQFQSGALVQRANVIEGHRVYAAFQPAQFMHQLFAKDFHILAHYEGKTVSWGIEQDYWVVKKK